MTFPFPPRAVIWHGKGLQGTIAELSPKPLPSGRKPMTSRVLLVAAIGWSIAAAADNDPTKDDLHRLQGRWMPVYVEVDGAPIDPEGLDELKELEVVVKGNKVILKEEGEVHEGWHINFKLDQKASPRTIDLSVAIEEFKPQTSLGIYKFDGDTLTICIQAPSKDPERPATFETRPGSRNRLWKFKRK
jgi:uncharacterized protein (TIGR03067 family)